MAAVELISQVNSLVRTRSAGSDVITNHTPGLLVLCVGEKVAKGAGFVVVPKAGTTVELNPGESATVDSTGEEGTYIVSQRSAGATADYIVQGTVV